MEDAGIVIRKLPGSPRAPAATDVAVASEMLYLASQQSPERLEQPASSTGGGSSSSSLEVPAASGIVLIGDPNRALPALARVPLYGKRVVVVTTRSQAGAALRCLPPSVVEHIDVIYIDSLVNGSQSDPQRNTPGASSVLSQALAPPALAARLAAGLVRDVGIDPKGLLQAQSLQLRSVSVDGNAVARVVAGDAWLQRGLRAARTTVKALLVEHGRDLFSVTSASDSKSRARGSTSAFGSSSLREGSRDGSFLSVEIGLEALAARLRAASRVRVAAEGAESDASSAPSISASPPRSSASTSSQGLVGSLFHSALETSMKDDISALERT